MKLYLESAGGSLRANFTGGVAAPDFEGSAGRGPEAKLILNARVQMPPAELERLAREQLAIHAGSWVEVAVVDWRSFSPARPVPTHRVALAAGGR